jgi:glycosyltransferase involved in cell wall biosynthesis
MAESVSVVITSYNLIDYIGDAVSSVKMQDYSGEIQVIVVDDCSSDGTVELLKDIEGIDLVLRERNGGVMNAMISGLRVSSHDVVFFLDGDDIWSHDKLSKSMDVLCQATCFVTHDLLYLDSSGSPLVKSTRVKEVLGAQDTSNISLKIKHGILHHCDYVWLGSAFGLRKSLNNLDGFISFCENYKCIDFCYQDWPIAVWCALNKGGKFGYSDTKLLGYRIHNNNYSGSSQTIQKYRRNLKKAVCTMNLIISMLSRQQGYDSSLHRYRQVLRYSRLNLLAVHDNRRMIIKNIMIHGFPFSCGKGYFKAASRLALALVFGPEFAHACINKFKGLIS